MKKIKKAARVLRDGWDGVSDSELIALVLDPLERQPKAPELAAGLLAEFDGLRNVFLASPARLMEGGGLDRTDAIRLFGAFELGLRLAEQVSEPRPIVRSSADVVALMGPRLHALEHEQIWIVGLDGRSRVTAKRRIAEGGQHGCALLARDVLRAALSLGASSFLLVHNHPGGDCTPSRDDIGFTRRVAEAASCIGLPLVDHVIVASGSSSSLLDLGLLTVERAIVGAQLAAQSGSQHT